MKKFKKQCIAGVLALTLTSNIYGAEVKQVDTPQVTQSESEEVATESESVLTEIEATLQVFEANGMTNLLPQMKRREEKKWTKIINEGGYLQGEEGMLYQLKGVYELGEEQYYLVGWGENAEQVPAAMFQLILKKEEKQYFATYTDYPSEKLLTVEEIALYKKEEQQASNIDIAYDQVDKLGGVGEYVGYLDKAIEKSDQGNINDTAKGEVTQYVQYALEELSSESMEVENNTIQVETTLLDQMKDSVADAKNEFESLLSDKDIAFNKSLNTILKLETEKVDFRKPIHIQLPERFEDLGEVTGMRILLGDEGYVYIDSKDFDTLAGMNIKIERMKDKKTYDITFLTPNGEVIPKIERTITFAFSAKDELTTVLAHYEEGQEPQNWGGQYDGTSRLIAFGTKYSGQYEIVDDSVKIKDIGGLTKSQQSAIKFMVSKGYLTIENERFNPNQTFTRYEFAEALVKMFFALDTSLTTSLKDVPKDSHYYPYVASGETYDIIKGYEDGTFKGEVNILKEQVISLCARTVADQKGYVYPEHLEDYLKFADAEKIGAWATKDIALAVQSGLLTSGGELSPKDEITRVESAEILYQLFMLLYETTPGEIVDIGIEEKTYSIVGVILLALLVLWLIRRFIKKNKVVLTLLVCTAAIVITLIIGFKGGF